MPNQEILNLENFQKSISRELFYTKDRIRNLIGRANWAEEGRYKEAILKKVIKQFLPSNLEIGTGFIASRYDNENYNQDNISNQLDLIIYDNSIPVIFREGDFVILTESSVRGIIEVKSKLNNSKLKDAIEKFEDLRKFQILGLRRKLFIGLFIYEFCGDVIDDSIKTILKNSKGLVNHISLGTDTFIRFWENDSNLAEKVECDKSFYNIYDLVDLSFSYFISNILHITADEDPDDRHWFSFPIKDTKETHKIDTICCD